MIVVCVTDIVKKIKKNNLINETRTCQEDQS